MSLAVEGLWLISLYLLLNLKERYFLIALKITVLLPLTLCVYEGKLREHSVTIFCCQLLH